ncbi:adenine-specific DNA-methyltransferase [Altererythrobacter atlanticus]|uniref:site-specific DNA-methyltransferase (adenine-specific) n=1 Tax=Croceibacterium atlanticum TaxID=1267766 RepID=A0A0F7KQ08_9SPHN|nr:site-specific DNA-methyltransferase [Croceibacterium atlanticum]AKH41639.1 Modification methylase DpnIIB [Croceibacterium atlanticum]MBB5733102.1 adenine-specific DNA-methyltransferase [Croceibacterium atlanticum]
MARKPKAQKQVGTLNYEKDVRRNIPTAEMADLAAMQEEMAPLQPVAYPRARPLAEGEVRERNEDLDPQIVWKGLKITLTKDQVAQLAETGTIEIGDAQLVWRGKDRQDWSDLIVTAPPLYIQEKVHPKAIIDDLVRQTEEAKEEASDAPDLFADFNGLSDPMARTEFYQHDQHWSNRMILGDSLQVMASLAEREALKGKVQAIYFDPPYGIKFNSNWQVSTQSRDVKDGKREDLSREPEQVKAFRDTWKDGIHSYLTYLRDRLLVMRELLTESGSIFVQISDENVHRMRALLDEVFGEENFVSQIAFKKTTGLTSGYIASNFDHIVWYGKSYKSLKFRSLLTEKGWESDLGFYKYLRDKESGALENAIKSTNEIPSDGSKQLYSVSDLTSSHDYSLGKEAFPFRGQTYSPARRFWTTSPDGMRRLAAAQRIHQSKNSIRYVRLLDDYPVQLITSNWADTITGQYSDERTYVVQTAAKVVQRCLLMTTDPGDLVLDPTCGSGTTAYVAEQWGRRWITIDTSRVALALARTRIMAARYPWYLLADSEEGKRKEAEITGKLPSDRPSFGDVRQGFVLERVPHVTLKAIANNSEIDVIWDKWQERLEPLRAELNQATSNDWQEWEIPREPEAGWSSNVVGIHQGWWDARKARQQEIDASIARAADVEYLYDKPYTDNSRIRVAGPFTVESLSPHRIVPADAEELVDQIDAEAYGMEGSKPRKPGPLSSSETDFAAMVIEHLKTAGVHQTDKADRIAFTSLTPFAGRGYIAAEGRFMEGEAERRAAIFIGPEFGTLSRVDLTAAAREASESRFDVLIAVSFAFDAHASELTRLGPLPILKAKMNPDLHMSEELKNTGKGNLFTVFGEPDIDILEEPDGRIAVRVNGVDIYDPNTGEVRSNDVKGIAAWFIDTAYNEESFFVRHAYFLGANDPYKQLKTTLKAEIDEEAWATLNRATSRPFNRPESGRIAVKVINHFGDEVMKVFGV